MMRESRTPRSAKLWTGSGASTNTSRGSTSSGEWIGSFIMSSSLGFRPSGLPSSSSDAEAQALMRRERARMRGGSGSPKLLHCDGSSSATTNTLGRPGSQLCARLPAIVDDCGLGIKQLLKHKLSKAKIKMTDFVCGALAGAAADTCLYPLDTLRARMMVRPITHGLLAEARLLVRAEGARALYRGLPVHLAASMPGCGVFYATYETAKATLAQVVPGGPLNHLASAAIACLASLSIYTPMEVVKQARLLSLFSRLFPILPHMPRPISPISHRVYFSQRGESSHWSISSPSVTAHFHVSPPSHSPNSIFPIP